MGANQRLPPTETKFIALLVRFYSHLRSTLTLPAAAPRCVCKSRAWNRIWSHSHDTMDQDSAPRREGLRVLMITLEYTVAQFRRAFACRSSPGLPVVLRGTCCVTLDVSDPRSGNGVLATTTAAAIRGLGHSLFVLAAQPEGSALSEEHEHEAFISVPARLWVRWRCARRFTHAQAVARLRALCVREPASILSFHLPAGRRC